MGAIIKRRLRQILEAALLLLPFGEQLLIRFVRYRGEIRFRGVFASEHEARQHLRQHVNYDEINRNKELTVTSGLEPLDSWLAHHDYPLLFWMSQLAPRVNALIELGGSLGHFYYSSKKLIDYPVSVDWIIAELPEAVALGQCVAEGRGEKQLRFIQSQKISEEASVDMLMTAGTIQYMPQSLPELLRALPQLPLHLLVHELPMHSSREFWTLQQLKVGEFPYHVYSAERTFQALNDLGYEIVDQWQHARLLEIPFQSDCKLEHYSGFYARLKKS